MEEEQLHIMTGSGATNTDNENARPQITYPEGNWKRISSYASGEYLKMEDEMETVNRGGKRVKMVKTVSFHVAVIPIGELDEYGKDLLDAMLEGERDHINDILNFFKTYQPHPGLTFNKRAWKDAQQADINKEREEEMKLIKDMMKEKMEKMMNKQETDMDEDDTTLNLDDPDFEKVPFMDPEFKNHTFKEWFKILYCVCDPKGLTDDQCVEVMENCMGGSYLTETQDMKTQKYSLKKIQKHFVDKDIIKDPGYSFDLVDPDFKKVPCMDPDNKMHTFEEWFEILYSICDPKGLTDDQCVDVIEVCMVGLYNAELQNMKTKKYSLGMIEKHYLRKDIILDPGCIFDENDTDFEKIPYMHPNKKENTFKDFFESLYSVCDSKGFTDEQCTDVMEIRMGDTYLDELKELKNNNSDLDTIELHFLFKDSQKGTQEKVEKKKKKKDSKINMINRKELVSEINKKEKVFNLEDPDFRMVPFIEPENNVHSFEEWFEILYSICDPKGLTKDQCVDVMELRMGGSYLSELQDMKAQQNSLKAIERKFKEKDMMTYPVCTFDENETNRNKLGEELEELKDIVLHVLSKDVQENEMDKDAFFTIADEDDHDFEGSPFMQSDQIGKEGTKNQRVGPYLDMDIMGAKKDVQGDKKDNMGVPVNNVNFNQQRRQKYDKISTTHSDTASPDPRKVLRFNFLNPTNVFLISLRPSQKSYPNCKVSLWYDYMNTAMQSINKKTNKQPLQVQVSTENIPKGKAFKFSNSNKYCGNQMYCITLWNHYNQHDILYRSPFHTREMSSCLGEY